jgi:DnaJ-domain-containing protein 1
MLAADMKLRLTEETLQNAILGKNGEFADISRNPAQDIWNELAVLYKQPAKRTTPTDEQQGDLYKSLLRWSDFHPFWQQVEVELAAFNDLLIYPTVRKRRGRQVLQHNVAAGDTVSVFFDYEMVGNASEPVVAVFFKHYLEDGNPRTNYSVWTKSWAMDFAGEQGWPRIDEDGTKIDDEADDGDLHEAYGGEWPFVFVHKNATQGDFWDQTSGERLVDLTLKVGRRQTDDDYQWFRSRFKQLLVIGERIKHADKSLHDISAFLKILGQGISAQVVDWQVDSKAHQDTINGEEIRAAASYGINAERLRRTSYQTAEGARLSERGLTERRERFEPIFARIEDEYYWLCCATAQAHNMPAVPNPDAELEVIFAPIEYVGDPLAQLEVDEKRTKIGYQSIVDGILAEHPSWTRAQALDYLKRNLEELAEVQKLKQAAAVPENDLANRSLIDEREGAKGPIARDKPADDSTEPATPIPNATGE